jgi:phosphate transport system substrate-binding protein
MTTRAMVRACWRGRFGLGAVLALCWGFALAQPIRIDGSSTVYPITEAVARAFTESGQRAAKVVVGISGTGGGFRKFCRGDIDIANASRPIQRGEMEECKAHGVRFAELPIAFDALTVVVSRKNTFVQQISVEELRRIWEPDARGKIMTWKQVNPAWPEVALKLHGPGIDSGTFDYFTEAVVGKAGASRDDYRQSEDDDIIAMGVARDAGGLGYFGAAYFAQHKDQLRALPVVPGPGGSGVAPTAGNVLNGMYRPLARPLFLYVSEAALGRQEVKTFLEHFLARGGDYARQANYVPLPPAAYVAAAQWLKERRYGSIFGGRAEVGITIRELLGREAR